MDKWIRYRRGESGLVTSVPRVSLTKSMMLSINRGAFEILGEPEAVELFFDPKGLRIGIKKSEPADGNGYPLRRKPNGPYRYVYVMGFCRRFGIVPAQSVTFMDVEADENGFVTLELKKALKLNK